jgi:hypothetical protein
MMIEWIGNHEALTVVIVWLGLNAAFTIARIRAR